MKDSKKKIHIRRFCWNRSDDLMNCIRRYRGIVSDKLIKKISPNDLGDDGI